MTHPISILIRTFNSAGTLDAVLTRLRWKAEDELIIVDSGSTDGTLAIAEKYNAKIIPAPPPFNYGKSLNLGFQAAKNPWVLVMSSHCLPLGENLVESFRQAIPQFPETLGVAYGECSLVGEPSPASAQEDRAGERNPGRFQTQIPSPQPSPHLSGERESKPGSSGSQRGVPWEFAGPEADAAQRRRIYGGNGLALYRREAWVKQPFDQDLPTGEDLTWFVRTLAAGGMAAHIPEARVLYRNRGSLRHMFRKGWEESRMAARLTGRPPMHLWKLGLWWGSLFKKWLTGKIPISVLLRQGAHALGTYLSSRFTERTRTSS